MLKRIKAPDFLLSLKLKKSNIDISSVTKSYKVSDVINVLPRMIRCYFKVSRCY